MIGESFTVVFKTTKSAFGENFIHMQMVVVVTLVLLLMTLLMCGIVDDVAGVVVDVVVGYGSFVDVWRC